MIPLFTDAHILRREMLISLSDYAIEKNVLRYQGYSNGILYGCELTTTQKEIILNPGIICYEGRVYLIQETMSVSYYPTNRTMICCIQFSKEERTENFIYRESKISLVEEETLEEDMLEICRFKLQEGAKLRYEYVDFDDRCTEYDTLNTIYAPYAAKKESTISLDILQGFAKQLMKAKNRNEFDVMFSLQILNQVEPMGKEIIIAYIEYRKKETVNIKSNIEIYQYLSMILGEVEHGEDSSVSTQKKNQWKIMID